MDDSFKVNIKCMSTESVFYLELPKHITVKHVKELLKQYHPSSPMVKHQKIIHSGEILENSDELFEKIRGDMLGPVYMTYEQGGGHEEPNFTSDSFKSREVLYLLEYKQLLSSMTHESPDQHSALIPANSLISYIPLCHPDVRKRMQSARLNQPRPIRLHNIRLSRLLDFGIFMHTMSFLFIAYIFGQTINYFVFLLMVIVYLVEVKKRIAKHRQRQLDRLPAEYLRMVIPDVQNEQIPQAGNARHAVEFFRSFFLSFLPWFDPQVYKQQRARVIANNA